MGGIEEFPQQNPFVYGQTTLPFYNEAVPQMAPHMYPLQRPQMMSYDYGYAASQPAYFMNTGGPSEMGTSSIYNMRRQYRL